MLVEIFKYLVLGGLALLGLALIAVSIIAAGKLGFWAGTKMNEWERRRKR